MGLNEGSDILSGLKDKNILMGITGGIAVYKAAELVRLFKKNGSRVKVIMTRSANEFVTALTFQTLSENLVITDMFEKTAHWDVEHIELAKWADLFVIVPATANIIGKIYSGIADDMLSTTVMATKAPVVIAPAMNVNMYDNMIVRRNIKALTDFGYHFVSPGTGFLACGDVGAGRLADIDKIAVYCAYVLSEKDYAGKKVLISAGPTRERIDPVRYISNFSSGKMGYALAAAAYLRGADVTLVAGPNDLESTGGIELIKVESAQQMKTSIGQKFDDADIVIMAAAVADYKPKIFSDKKIKKNSDDLNIALEKNPDILKELGKIKKGQYLVGFAAETDHAMENARKKLIDKNVDMLVLNDVTMEGAGFDVDTNIVKILMADGTVIESGKRRKFDISNLILDTIKSHLYFHSRL